jgi:lipoate-protein ligase A
MVWNLLDTGKRSATENMALDLALLSDLEDGSGSILHLYDWEKESATYGHFIDPEKFLNMKGVFAKGLDLAKRPTGGGIVFHTCDLAFSVLVPHTDSAFSQNPLDNYAYVNNRVIWAIQQVVPHLKECSPKLLPEEPSPLDIHCKSFCMAKPTKYDVMIQGKKIGGAAQRKTRFGFLHQGSISLGSLSDEYLSAVLAPETQVLAGMRQNSFSLLGEKWTLKELEQMRQEFRVFLKKAFSDQFIGD